MCPHISHPPKWRKSSKKVPHMLGKKNFRGRGRTPTLAPSPPPAMVGGKSRPSAPPWKTIEGLFLLRGGGGGAFLPCEGFFATFSSYVGPFSPCGGHFCYVFSLCGDFFTMPFCYFFLWGGPFVTFFSSGVGAFCTLRGSLLLRFSPYGGAFLLLFLYVGNLFLIIGGLFWASPPYDSVTKLFEDAHAPPLPAGAQTVTLSHAGTQSPTPPLRAPGTPPPWVHMHTYMYLLI